MMAFRFRKVLPGLVTKYGHKLVLVIVPQIITLLISTIYFAVYEYDVDFVVFFSSTKARYNVYIIINELVLSILPMMASLSCLIFAYMRHKQEKTPSKDEVNES